MIKIKTIVLLSFGIFLFCVGREAKANHDMPEEYQIRLIEYFGNKGRDISGYFEDPRFRLIEDIRDKFERAVEIKIDSFEAYQDVLNYDLKKKKIADFAASYQADLEMAEQNYGIPKEVIIGILGVESEYGRFAGAYNPFNAYVSMYAADYRADFALAQLEELFRYADKHNLDIMDLKSSYAGAISYAQFLPWSLNRWFVGNDLYDMGNNIMSVANYLAHFKEVTGSLEAAILRYNTSTLYRQAVLSLADDAKDVLGPDK